MSDSQSTGDILVREARLSDLEGLSAICYGKHPAIHRDRLRDADGCRLRYLVAEVEGTIAGFALLVFQIPANRPDSGTTEFLPAIWNLYVTEKRRGRGIGTRIIHHAEGLAACAGYGRLYIGVDSIGNRRAYELYLRLGYRPLYPEPIREHWRFTDSEGYIHQGDQMILHLVRVLSSALNEEEP